MKKWTTIKSLGALKKAGYEPKGVKEEIRENLIHNLKKGISSFPGVWGYEQTVIPDLERAILSEHNILLLGLRGQAKTMLARLMVKLMDENIPVVAGSEINDDPFKPLSKYARDLVEEKGDKTPIEWLHRDQRFSEKLATPDVSIADLVGDIDPIKAANNRMSYSDEGALHFGLIPRSHRGLFVINELPDLQARIQVSLFNILQEGDLQIRGFKLRFPLDILFVFTANPEDYTNRGRIVTPLKDRIESQILTHYPPTTDIARKITEQEAGIKGFQEKQIEVNDITKEIIEEIAFAARASEFIDAKSGVSTRLTISAMENLYSAIERRMHKNNERKGFVRVGDFSGIIPSITGKVELVYEGEQEGAFIIAQKLMIQAIRNVFPKYFPNPQGSKKDQTNAVYTKLLNWFDQKDRFELFNDYEQKVYEKELKKIQPVTEIVDELYPKLDKNNKFFMMEFLLHGLAAYSLIQKEPMQAGFYFADLLNSMLKGGGKTNPFENDEDYYFE